MGRGSHRPQLTFFVGQAGPQAAAGEPTTRRGGRLMMRTRRRGRGRRPRSLAPNRADSERSRSADRRRWPLPWLQRCRCAMSRRRIEELLTAAPPDRVGKRPARGAARRTPRPVRGRSRSARPHRRRGTAGRRETWLRGGSEWLRGTSAAPSVAAGSAQGASLLLSRRLHGALWPEV
eukprot:COSAG01_NODE_5589_length_4160_cov_2.299926_3_plen_177_part_00